VDQHPHEAGRPTDVAGIFVRAKGYHGLHEKLVDRFGQRVGEALSSFIASGLALCVSGLLAWLFKQPFIFPSLGPTAYLFFDTLC
jgi:hypothetical protein